MSEDKNLFRIALITRNFPPLTGGMERLMYHVFKHFEERHCCALIGPKGCRAYAYGSPVIESSVSSTIVFLIVAFFKCIGYYMYRSKPDVFVGGSGLVAPIVVIAAKIFGAKAVIFVHGLDLVVESPLYQYICVPFIRWGDLIISNSANTLSLARNRGICEEKVEIINPGVAIPSVPIDQLRAKEELELVNKKILLSVGRLVARKGLAEFVERSLPYLVKKDNNFVLIIVGDEPRAAINRERASSLKKINAAVVNQGLSDHVVLMSAVSDKQLSLLYCAADVFVFPLLEVKGDVEGFGMVAVEAGSWGVPTVAFDVGGVSDAVTDGVNGRLVRSGEYVQFADAVLASMGAYKRDAIRKASERYSWENYYAKLDESLVRLFSGKFL